MQEILQFIEKIDKKVLFLINDAHTPFLDVSMEYFSEKFFWLPFYLLFLYLIHKAHGIKGLVLSLFAVALLITITDQLSVQAFKETIKRYRPCKNLIIGEEIRNIVSCGGKYGFVSSHASNFFGVAVFISFILRDKFKWIIWLCIPWALLIGYSRVYLGKHYPLDVLGGAILGIIIGWIIYRFYFKVLDKIKEKH